MRHRAVPPISRLPQCSWWGLALAETPAAQLCITTFLKRYVDLFIHSNFLCFIWNPCVYKKMVCLCEERVCNCLLSVRAATMAALTWTKLYTKITSWISEYGLSSFTQCLSNCCQQYCLVYSVALHAWALCDITWYLLSWHKTKEYINMYHNLQNVDAKKTAVIFGYWFYQQLQLSRQRQWKATVRV